VSQAAQDDLDGLLATVLPVAEDLLARSGEFFPFGASVSRLGETSLTAADPGRGERPASDAVLADLLAAARSVSDAMRGVAFVADVLVQGSDAVRVELEHAEGVALVVLLPYSRSRFKKSVSFEPMSVAAGEMRIWPGT
jgi:hypothetical protein